MTEANLYDSPGRWSEKHREQQEGVEEAIFFTTVRQQGVAVDQINFRLKSGHQHALPVNQIEEIYFESPSSIVLFCRFGIIQIQGRCLEPLYTQLWNQKVLEIREFSEKSNVLFDKDALVITSIQYESDHLRNLEVMREKM